MSRTPFNVASDIDVFMRAADKSAGRTALGLDTAATHPATDFDASGAAAAAAAASIPTTSRSTDGTMASNSTTLVPSQSAVVTYVAAMVAGLLDFKGGTDCSSNPNYPVALKGDSYAVTVAGKIGGASGKSVEVGDMYVAVADNAGGTEASVGTSWIVLQANITGITATGLLLMRAASAAAALTVVGGIGGTTGSTDKAVLVSDGTAGASAQATPVTVNVTTGAMLFPAAPNVASPGSIKGGNAWVSFYNNQLMLSSNNSIALYVSYDRIELEGRPLAFSVGGTEENADTWLARVSAGVLGLSNSTAQCSFQISMDGTKYAKVGGVIFDHFADVATSSTNGTEDDLYTDTMVAGLLAANGQKIVESEYLSILGSATAARRVKKYFGGTLIFDSGALTLAAGADGRMLTEIIRESSSVVRVTVTVSTTSASTIPYVTYTRVTGLTLTNTQILKTTAIASGTGAASGDIVNKMASIAWHPAA